MPQRHASLYHAARIGLQWVSGLQTWGLSIFLVFVCEKIESKLDAGAGRCFLAKPDVVRAMVGALRYYDSVRYLLHAWCVMPNHGHVLFHLFGGHALAAVIHCWKSYSAKEANGLLRRSGEFWMREYYNYLVRSEEEFYQVRQYILDNPQKAGLSRLALGGSGRSGVIKNAGEMPALRTADAPKTR